MDVATNNTSLSLRCPAKLNLTLAVGAPRDDGLHPIASVMVALDFGDDLHLHRRDHGPSAFTRRLADDAMKPQPIDWPIESDLLYRAHALLQSATGKALPIACELEKRIPAGAGLGGGSSNAAAILVGLRQLFELPVNDQTLLELAQQLGADVVFLTKAMLGQPAALVTGIGEVIEPLDNLTSFDCILVAPEGQCPTPDVYRAFDQQNPTASIPDELTEQWRKGKALPAALNDLHQPAISICPSIEPAAEAIKAQRLEPRLTGSGSALFAIVGSKQQAIGIAESIRKSGIAACCTSYPGLP